MKNRPNEALLPLVKPMLLEKGWTIPSDTYVLEVIGLLKERVILLPDFAASSGYFFEDPVSYDETAKAKNWKTETPSHLTALNEALKNSEPFDAANIETALRKTAESFQAGAGKLIHPMRLAISGVSNGPSLFHMAEVLGKECVTRRIETALRSIQ
jgi:glutamyl-tRNA synthetase